MDHQEEQENELSSGLKLWADVGLSIGKSLDDVQTQIKNLEAKLEKNVPVDYSTSAAGVFVTGTPLVLELGGPDKGHMWEVSQIAIGGTEINVTAAGSAGAYISALPTLAGAGLTNLADVWASLPNVVNYGTAQQTVNDAESLFVIVFGGTNAQTYVASAQMRDFDLTATTGVEFQE